jgi:hypothetical protein
MARKSFFVILVALLTLSGCRTSQSNHSTPNYYRSASTVAYPISYPLDYQASNESLMMFGNQYLTVMAYYETRFAQLRPKYPYLSNEEMTAIYLYTGSLYSQVNRALRTMSLTDELLNFADVLASAVRKAPKFVGLVYRGAHLNDTVIAHYEQAYYSGQPIQEYGFTSTSYIDNTSMWSQGTPPGKTTVKFFIQSLTGVNVEDFAAHPGEFEVLFAAGTWFAVTGFERIVTQEMGQPRNEVRIAMAEFVTHPY